KFNIGRPISQRPKEIKKRNTFGHWEADTIVSSRGKSKGCIATFAERKSRYYYCVLMPKFNIGRPISQRPKEIKKRNTFGHWEADTIVSS
ncbi:hypothetical protein V8443_14785, partial [Staphylococcus aureus]